jgi:hypothetical protein
MATDIQTRGAYHGQKDGQLSGCLLINDGNVHTFKTGACRIEALGGAVTISITSDTLKNPDGSDITGLVLADGRRIEGIFGTVQRTAGSGMLLVYAA